MAEHLSAFFAGIGLPAVERVPVIGRTGPDIEINEFGLIVDVKSRLSVPAASFPGTAINDDLAWTTLDNLEVFACTLLHDVSGAGKSKMANDWLDHMHKWTEEKYQEWRKKHGEAKYPELGISGIVLHKAAKKNKAKMPVGQAVFIMYRKDLELFSQRHKQYRKQEKE